MSEQPTPQLEVSANLRSRLQPFLDSLREQQEVSRLCNALSLAEGFRFYVATCETPRVAAALQLWVQEEVPRRREEPLSTVRISPYALSGTDGVTGLSPQELTLHIMDPLVSLPAEQAPMRMVVLDVAPAASSDWPAWVWAFQRMNERRDLIAQRVKSPLLLCLPPGLEVSFIRSAPDFWSIRSMALTVRDPGGLTEPRPLPPPQPEVAVEPPVSEELPAHLLQELEEARKAAQSSHPDALRRLAILLTRYANSQRAAGQLEASLATLQEEALPLWQQLGDSQRICHMLIIIVGIWYTQGRLDDALHLLQQWILPATNKTGNQGQRASALHYTALILQELGQLDEALRIHLEEQIPIYEALGDTVSRAAALLPVASMLELRGRTEEALQLYQEQILPTFKAAGSTLAYSMALGKFTELLQSRGQLNEALRLLREEVLPVLAQAGQRRAYAITLGRLADILQELGNFNESMRIRLGEEIPIYEEVGDMLSKAATLGNAARALHILKRTDEAISITQEQVLPVCEKSGSRYNLMVVRMNLASFYLDRGRAGDHLRAVRLLEVALQESRELRAREETPIQALLEEARKHLP
jgi:tetratricopeptide (TPR) repeat protein